MKHPVLRVKKGSEKYDDCAQKVETPIRREAQPPTGRRRPWMFRTRRASLLPVLILVVIAVVLLRVFPRSAARADIGSWHAVLEARVSADRVDVGVAFSRRWGTADAGSADVSILFFLPDTRQQASVLGTLSGERVALMSRMQYTGVEKTVRAIVRINGESRTLSLPLTAVPPGP